MLNVQEIKVERLKPWKDNPRLNERAVDGVTQFCTGWRHRFWHRIIAEEP
jgi:hypothetical protein